MSVLIKGMKMPKCCYECFALDDNGDYPFCLITEDQRGYTFKVREKRMDSCPLVNVPEPHGRLIDADALFKIIKWHHDLYKGSENASDKARRDENLQVMCDITDAPTVIEAEGE